VGGGRGEEGGRGRGKRRRLWRTERVGRKRGEEGEGGKGRKNTKRKLIKSCRNKNAANLGKKEVNLDILHAPTNQKRIKKDKMDKILFINYPHCTHRRLYNLLIGIKYLIVP
jgi:hypothetical protein